MDKGITSHETMAKAIENLDQRVITGIKIERWIAALFEIKNLFYCTREELEELALEVAKTSPEHTEDDKARQEAMLNKIRIVQHQIDTLPLVANYRAKPVKRT